MPFLGVAGETHRQHLGAVLIASRIENVPQTASQRCLITEYADAVLVSLTRRSGIIITLTDRLDMFPYHEQFQTIENDVEPGDVLELYHMRCVSTKDNMDYQHSWKELKRIFSGLSRCSEKICLELCEMHLTTASSYRKSQAVQYPCSVCNTWTYMCPSILWNGDYCKELGVLAFNAGRNRAGRSCSLRRHNMSW